MESFSLKTEAWAGSPGAELRPGPAPPPGLPQPRPAMRARPLSEEHGPYSSLGFGGHWGNKTSLSPAEPRLNSQLPLQTRGAGDA